MAFVELSLSPGTGPPQRGERPRPIYRSSFRPRTVEGSSPRRLRALPESPYVMSPTFFHYLYTRHLMSRLFNKLAQLVLLPGILDTQAGLKGFTAQAAEKIFSRQTLCGFGFDLEVLFIARSHHLKIEQMPVDYHYNDEPTTVNFAKHGVEMLLDLIRVRLNGARGIYA